MTRIYHHGFRNELTEWVEGYHYEHLVLGRCHGIALSRRGADDPHVSLTWLTEDDELWHCGQDNRFSSYWIDDSLDVLKRANRWLKTNCDPDPSGYGYVFRSMNFYTYIWTDPKNSIPRYVGKGKGQRVWSPLDDPKSNSRISWLMKQRRDEGFVCIPQVFWFETEEEALAEEVRLIASIGREDLGQGPLFNGTDGAKHAARRVKPVFPSQKKLFVDLGERLRLARLRRKFSADIVCQRAGISRMTLFRAEDGSPSISLKTLARILSVLGLQADLELVAGDDKVGRLLQDQTLPQRRRKRSSQPEQVCTPE